MEENIIKVQMLGDFSLEFAGEKFAIERNSATKVNQLFQILLYEKKGIPRVDLWDALFDNEYISNPSNSLRALVFRLRKALIKAGLPDDEFVHISRGVYSFSSRFEIECDAINFEEGVENLSKISEINARIEKLFGLYEMYQGAFLPMITSSTWCTTINVRLRKKYLACVRELCKLLFDKHEIEKVLEVSSRAIELYPYEGLQTYKMQALIKLGKHNEAMRLYEETERVLYNELGVSVPKEMKSMLDELGNNFTYSSDVMENVQKNLETIKKDEEGAFYCSFPSFTENYRYVRRVIRRGGQSAWLMLCTITDGKGVGLAASERLDELSNELYTAINETIRGGDMFTKYSDNQYLLLLLEITKEDCTVVQERIMSSMEKDGRKKYFKFSLAPVNENAIGGTSYDEDISAIVRGLE